MKKFFVLFCIPAAAIQEWMTKVDEKTRKEQSDKMMQDWKTWMETHKASIVDGGMPIGKTKRVTKDGAMDAKNDINWYLVVEANSHEAAAAMFAGHPHLQIPTAYIDVSDASRPGME